MAVFPVPDFIPAREDCPKAVLYVAEVVLFKLFNEVSPMAMLLLPVVLLNKALEPNAIFLVPEVFSAKV